MSFQNKLQSAARNSGSVLCTGLDPVPGTMPPELREQHHTERELILTWCRRIIEQTKTSTAAYKLNLAYFEAIGPEGFALLDELLDAIPSGKILIADAKRGDVPHSNERYKTAFFDRLGFDAITLSPFLGTDTLVPFLGDPSRAVYALTLTSNPGASELMTRPFGEAPSLSAHVASLLRSCAAEHPGTIGMVIGATQHEIYGPVMEAYPEAPLLIPGVGAQSGSVSELQQHLARHKGIPLINVSRGISAFDPESSEPWDMQIADNTARFKRMLQPISDRYLDDPPPTTHPPESLN
jgi:orotidine-5'-phosphate decarboxylase